ncbi:Nn.00g083370.m01.CDS01 [Neocucurbitaria sp. VM-36]
MPSTRPNRPLPKPSQERTRTAIIVSVVIGTLAVLALILFLRSRRMRRSAKAGTAIETTSASWDLQQRQDKEMEVGVVQEPLPVYRREVGEDERWLDGVVGDGREKDSGSMCLRDARAGSLV